MIPKKFLFLLCVVVALYSCNREGGYRESSSFDWRPRKVNNVFITLGYRTYYTFSGDNYTVYNDLDWYSNMVNSSFFLAILTSNHDPRILYAQVDSTYDVKTPMRIYYLEYTDYLNYYYLDEHNTNIEKQIQNNYDRYIGGGGAYVNGLAYDNIIRGEYRLTEITGLKIFTLNTHLFGKNVGEPLNDYFKIVKFNLPVIFTAPAEKLVYGYESISKSISNGVPVTIDEWLSLQPLAQETMWLVPTISIPEKLPLDVQFAVEMTTKEGKVLRDTMQTVTITE